MAWLPREPGTLVWLMRTLNGGGRGSPRPPSASCRSVGAAARGLDEQALADLDTRAHHRRGALAAGDGVTARSSLAPSSTGRREHLGGAPPRRPGPRRLTDQNPSAPGSSSRGAKSFQQHLEGPFRVDARRLGGPAAGQRREPVHARPQRQQSPRARASVLAGRSCRARAAPRSANQRPVISPVPRRHPSRSCRATSANTSGRRRAKSR